jgi:hypothetical protein
MFILNNANVLSFIRLNRIQITDVCTIFTDSETPGNQSADKVIPLSKANEGYG